MRKMRNLLNKYLEGSPKMGQRQVPRLPPLKHTTEPEVLKALESIASAQC